MRGELDALQQVVLVVHVLRQRHVEHRTRGFVEGEPRELRVADDADDAENGSVFRRVETEVLIDRILGRLEEALDEGFVDDGHRL